MTQRTFSFGTKSETLQRLMPLLKQAKILPLQYFMVAQWQSSPKQCLAKVAALTASHVVVRSSALKEDGDTSSMAGTFTSCLNVDASCAEALCDAINVVVASFDKMPDLRNQILVQPMLSDIQMSGVVMTHDIQHGAPYYNINYDDESGKTDTVTGGYGVEKSVMVYRGCALEAIRSPRLRALIAACRELEDLCGEVPLDIEFALDNQGIVYIFQVRRISLYRQWHPVTERRVARQLAHVRAYLETQLGPKSGLYGERSVLGAMPDWNPAEIIGANPRPLAASLYRQLVTDSIWREARAAMSYHHPKHQPLMLMVGQHPFIDVRASFNSFLPQQLAPNTASLLIDAWVARLASNPQLHDKVEFEIVPTCFDFDFDSQFASRYPDLLSRESLLAYRTALFGLTRSILTKQGLGGLKYSLDQIAMREQQQFSAHSLTGAAELGLERVRDLLQECRQLGTFHFAIIARHGFVAESLLRSASRIGVLNEARVAQWKTTITTVSGELTRDFQAVCDSRMTSEIFLARFGHLRPGTYDITSLRYDERSDLFVDSALRMSSSVCEPFAWTREETEAMDTLLTEEEWGISAEEFFSYAQNAIAGREYAKFVFTRDLSDALAALTLWGANNGLSRDDLSYLGIDRLLGLITDPQLDDLDRYLLNEVSQAKSRCADAELITLSHLVLDPSEVFVAPMHRAQANFIGQQCIEAQLQVLSANNTQSSWGLGGKIVCIENADPGYDWIFTRGIAGLITQYGGVNSHMAIRCAEFGIPAAIGCGEQLFSRLLSGRQGVLNCRDKTVTLV
ncbi:pyruvate, phosphate dikinase [Aeromonas sp. YN13HZO-058]|uniref:PEP-utilizing enzyme n=1 Tax=Aeromonas sp. YN13HZO-058 TaxID=1921564 RepID=UPI0009469E1D|nr:PEP-utilizing enzyme [Aeromonas sp. YN13HZO-058]OLF22432.1 pyruvate, phosphate dikinase [Aeromonas sp. YN13HZO-058]BBT80978.1 pyruvate, phosphate dikinase [Aeromonas veronii]